MEQRVPRVVFAVGGGLEAAALKTAFAREGLAADFAHSPNEFSVLISSADVFLIFLASEFGGGGARVIQEFKRRTRAVWIIMSKNAVARDKTKYFNLGASDFVKYPSPPAEFLTRAQNMLVRYLRAYSFDSAVTLPAFVAPPSKEASPVPSPAPAVSAAPAPAPTPAPGPARAHEPAVIVPTVRPTTFTETSAPAPTRAKAKLVGGEAVDQSFRDRLQGSAPAQNILRAVLQERPEEVVFLPQRREWKRETWPAAHLPPTEHKHFKNVGNSIHRCRTLFEETRKVLGAARIILFSVEAPEGGENFRCHVLVSSDPNSPRTNETANGEWFPQLFGAELARRGMFFNFSFDQSLSPKPSGWALTREGEAASAVLSVLDDGKAKAAILVEFAKLADEVPLELLAEAESFLREPAAEYRNIDFLCRVYRQANLPVDL